VQLLLSIPLLSIEDAAIKHHDAEVNQAVHYMAAVIDRGTFGQSPANKKVGTWDETLWVNLAQWFSSKEFAVHICTECMPD